jgi:hypothetical protein
MNPLTVNMTPEQIQRLEQRRRNFWANVGPLRQTEEMAQARERAGMRQDDPLQNTDYTLRGYRRSEFGSRQELEDWAFTHIPADEFERAKANIMRYGQTAIAHVRTNDRGFQSIDLEPVPGRFWSFETQAKRDEWARQNWKFHISLTYQHDSKEHPEVYKRVERRWDGQLVTIRIKKIHPSGNLELDDTDGIGADPNVQQLYKTGTYAGKWRGGFGPHIGM